MGAARPRIWPSAFGSSRHRAPRHPPWHPFGRPTRRPRAPTRRRASAERDPSCIGATVPAKVPVHGLACFLAPCKVMTTFGPLLHKCPGCQRGLCMRTRSHLRPSCTSSATPPRLVAHALAACGAGCLAAKADCRQRHRRVARIGGIPRAQATRWPTWAQPIALFMCEHLLCRLPRP